MSMSSPTKAMSHGVSPKRQAVFAEFADYDSATGGYVYNHTLCQGLERLGWEIERLVLPQGFPTPSPAAYDRMVAQFADVAPGRVVLIDQVCLSPLHGLAVGAASGLTWVNIFHHPMAHDLPPGDSRREAIAHSERAALDVARLVIASSATTARDLTQSFGVSPAKIVTALPGIERVAPRSPGPSRPDGDGTMRLLSVGAVVPRKDHPSLIAALHRLMVERPAMAWRCDIVGNIERDPSHVADLRHAITAAGLDDRVTIHGRLDHAALARLWAGADLYVSASRHEGYGMAIAEALVHGVPVVTTTAGAVAEWLPQTCARIVSVGDVAALATAIGDVLGDEGRRAMMGRAAAAQALRLPIWAESVATVSSALSRLVECRN